MNDFSSMWDFPVAEGITFPNANRVHPLMQRRMTILLDALAADQNVRRIILFGSSLEFRCNSYSDIDLYIEKEDPAQKLIALPDIDCEVDIIFNLAHDSRLYQEIDRTGLLLYEK